jgi:hypothetical protein
MIFGISEIGEYAIIRSSEPMEFAIGTGIIKIGGICKMEQWKKY